MLITSIYRSVTRQYRHLVSEYRQLGDHSDIRATVGRLREQIAELGGIDAPGAADMLWEIKQLKSAVAYRRQCRLGMRAEMLALREYLLDTRDREALLDGYDDGHEESVLFRRTRYEAGLKRAKATCDRDDGFTITRSGNIRLSGRHYRSKLDRVKDGFHRPKTKLSRKAKKAMADIEAAARQHEADQAAKARKLRQLQSIRLLTQIGQADTLDLPALVATLDGQLKPDHPLAKLIGTVPTSRLQVTIPQA